MNLKYPALLAALLTSAVQASDLVITGVIDGPLSGGTPKAIEIFVKNDIADLSNCGVGSANNAGGTDGEEFTFPNVTKTAGSYIYVASEATNFEAFMGFAPTYTDSAANINGDDSIELFCGGTVVDVFGEVGVDGTGKAWDHLDGWAYRIEDTGPDGDTFVLSNWIFSGTNVLDGETTNATAEIPFPAKSYSDEVGGEPPADKAPEVIEVTPANNSGVVALNANIEISFSEAVNAVGNWFEISCSESGLHTASVNAGPQHYTLNPDNDLAVNEVCTVTVLATSVNDVDVNDGADYMEANYSFSFGTKTLSNIVINEVDADTAGSDALEFIELYDGGVGNTSLDGLVVVLYNGYDNKSYKDAFDLDGFTTNSEGYFVLGNANVTPAASLIINNNALQNGADAVAVYVGNASDYPNYTPVSGFGLVDALVYDTSDSDDKELLAVLTPGQDQVNENGADDKDNHSNARVPDGGAALDTSVYLQQAPTPGKSNVTVAEIFAIQGSGLFSPFEDQYVATKNNVVTGVSPSGFFIQTPTSRSDNDVETSDAIYVYTVSAPSVTVGDHVDVMGNIIEFRNSFTEFSGGVKYEVISAGNALPPVVMFDENTPSKHQPHAANELERFESMVVTFDGVTTAATGRFGDVAVVVGTERAFREPGIEFPGVEGLPVWDGNPEIFELDPDGLGLDNETFFAGQSVSATGPLAHWYGDYQVWPSTLSKGPEPELLNKVRDKQAGEMTVGSLNMYRPSQYASVYAERLSKISNFVRNIMDSPDILAVSEVEDLQVLQTIADEINLDDNSVNYRPYLVEGNDVGGIDVGFLVRQSVEMDAVTQLGKDTIFDYDGRLLNDRPPLLFSGRVVADGSNFPIQVLVVHNRSLSRIDTSDRVRAKRLAQAQFVAGIVADIQTANPEVNLVVTGDFNAYQFTDGYVDVLGQITGTSNAQDNLLWEPSPVQQVLTNQVNNLAADEQYSFVFSGSAQVLDHALTSENLTSMVTGFEFARGNSDAPANLINDDSTALRSSDHDGLVLFIEMDSDNDSITDTLDLCPATSVPETAPSKGLKPNHFALLDGDIWFDTKKSKNSFSLVDTAGCSCEQIVEQQGLGKGHLKHGCSVGVMKNWVSKATQNQ